MVSSGEFVSNSLKMKNLTDDETDQLPNPGINGRLTICVYRSWNTDDVKKATEGIPHQKNQNYTICVRHKGTL